MRRRRPADASPGASATAAGALLLDGTDGLLSEGTVVGLPGAATTAAGVGALLVDGIDGLLSEGTVV